MKKPNDKPHRALKAGDSPVVLRAVNLKVPTAEMAVSRNMDTQLAETESCGCHSVCTCVPVEACSCHSVCTCDAVCSTDAECPCLDYYLCPHCACEGHCATDGGGCSGHCSWYWSCAPDACWCVFDYLQK